MTQKIKKKLKWKLNVKLCAAHKTYVMLLAKYSLL